MVTMTWDDQQQQQSPLRRLLNIHHDMSNAGTAVQLLADLGVATGCALVGEDLSVLATEVATLTILIKKFGSELMRLAPEGQEETFD